MTEGNKSSSILLGPAHCVLSQSLGSTERVQPTTCMGLASVLDLHQHQSGEAKPAPQTHCKASKATPRGRCSSAHVCSVHKWKSRFLQTNSPAEWGWGQLTYSISVTPGPGSLKTTSSHQMLLHILKCYLLSLFSVAQRSLQQDLDLPLLCSLHDKSFRKALALRLAKVDQKHYRPNGTAGKKQWGTC